MATTSNTARSKLVADLKRWTAEAKRTVGRAEVAKQSLRTIKAELKKARKVSKIAKKAAKDARKKLEAMLAGLKQLDAAASQAKAARAGETRILDQVREIGKGTRLNGQGARGRQAEVGSFCQAGQVSGQDQSDQAGRQDASIGCRGGAVGYQAVGCRQAE